MIWSKSLSRFKGFVKEYNEYHSPSNFIVSGSDETSIFAKKRFSGNVIVAKVDFRNN
jgi:hypothetical protein